MAKWSTFHWSDGTKWGEGLGEALLYTSFIDQLVYRLSVQLTYTAASGTTSAPVIMNVASEIGTRVYRDHPYVAFLDRNENTQYISPRVQYTSGATLELETEAGETLTTEAGDDILIQGPNPFSIDQIRLLANQRSRSQPIGS